MAVSAYASLVSLTHVLDNLHYRAQFHLPRADLKQVELLQGNVHFLLEFVELHSGRKSPEIQGLWREMAEVAFEVEERINLCVVILLHKRSQGKTCDEDFSDFCEVIETLIQKSCFIKEKLPVTKGEEEDHRAQKRLSALRSIGGSTRASSRVNNVAIGLDEHVVSIMDELTRGKSNLQIFSITGMGGIGKTTLARSVFDHPYIVEYFDIRIWLTISQEYSIEQILISLLDEGTKEPNKSFVELGNKLHKKLFGRKYLIVMDDVWLFKDWIDLKKHFPNNGVGRILLTTRLCDVAVSLGSQNPYQLNFLDEYKSWRLFCQKTFSQTGCPRADLNDIGKNIVKSCRGLPLEIVVIGHLLSNSNMTLEYWKFVAENISSHGNLSDDEHCLKVLSLSYESLSIHLKPCFLYMRTFPEDATIHIPDLIQLWIAEGFIKQLTDKSLEETAHEYLKELINRNLIFSRSMHECGIHDLLRDLCIRESNKEHFIRSPKVQHFECLSFHDPGCIFCGQSSRGKCVVDFRILVHISGSFAKARAYVCETCKMVYSHIARPIIVNVADVKGNDGLEEIGQPIELRYSSICSPLNLTCYYRSTLHIMWNLQFLNIDDDTSLLHTVFPPQIWEMPQLRHVRFRHGCCLANPVATHIQGEEFLVLKSLHTLSLVINFMFTEDILNRIPNLKDTEIYYSSEPEEGVEWSNYSLCDLARLQKLESLYLSAGALKYVTFPNSLKNLFLRDYRMTWENMSILGSLPNLESLKLYSGIEGSEWNPIEGEFLRLKQLSIGNTDLVCWRADQIHFPILEFLELQNMSSLEGIPLGIGDIPTLQSMALYYCSDSAVNSAMQIWEEQQSLGNESLQIHVEHRGVKYQINSFLARMTDAAILSWFRLKYILEAFQMAVQLCHHHHLNIKEMETAEKYIHVLRNIVEVRYQSFNMENKNLSWKIERAAVYAGPILDLDFNEFAISDYGVYTFSEYLRRLIEQIALIKEELL